MNQDVQKLLSMLNPEVSPEEIQPVCTRILSQTFNTFDEKCHSLFLVSNVYYKILNNFKKAEEILEGILKQDLNDKQMVECLGRLAFMNLVTNRDKAGKYYYDKALEIINASLDNQRKSLINILLWTHCGSRNPGVSNPHFNFLLSYVEEMRNNYQQAVVLLKKTLKQESSIDQEFIKWRIDLLNEEKNKSSKGKQFNEMNSTLMEVFSLFKDVSKETQAKELDTEKKKALYYLQGIYNKYQHNEEYFELLELLQEQMFHLETDEIPLPLVESLSNPPQSRPVDSLLQLRQASQFQIPLTSSYNPTSRPNTNPNISTSNLRPPHPSNHYASSYNMQSGIMPGSYLKPPVGWIGSPLIKLNYTTDGQKIKFFYIGDPSKKKLYYCERKEKPDPKFDSYYELRNITDVKQGKVTKALLRKSSAKYDQELSFSIILSNKTRDFVALNYQDHSYWIYTLKRFLPGASQNASISNSRNSSPTHFSRQKWGSTTMSRR